MTPWRFVASTRSFRIEAAPDGTGTRIVAAAAGGQASLEQTVAARPGKHFRVEARFRAALEGGVPDSGAVLAIRALDARRRVLDERETELVHRASTPLTLRAYYQTPRAAATLQVAVRVRRSRGTLDVLEARLIPIMEPEWRGHPIAIPPPVSPVSTPRTVRRMAVVTRSAHRPVVDLLPQLVGRDGVFGLDASAAVSAMEAFDALLMVDEAPPAAVRSPAALWRLAQNRLVIISTSAFAALTHGRIRVRTIEQEADPIHAAVTCGGPLTAGFALDDAFPFAWEGRQPGSFVQRQFPRTAALKSLCTRYGLAPLLKSVCDADATSDRILSLARLTPRGGLIVLDVLPLEAAPSTLAEHVPLATLLLNALGRRRPGLGQYVVPENSEADFRTLIRDMSTRFEGWLLHEDDVPIETLQHQLISIEPPQRRSGNKATSRPVILIRSGLTGGDLESVYAAWLYFKQLVRMPPHACPYAEALTAQCRLLWQPLCAPWEMTSGWRRQASAARTQSREQLRAWLEHERVVPAAVIDLVARPGQGARVVAADLEAPGSNAAAWLPRLWESFGPGERATWSAEGGGSAGNRDAFAWRVAGPPLEIVQAAGVFDDPLHHHLQRGGARLWRLEIPGQDADFVTGSIDRTGIGATLLEHVVGLHYGLIAVNRRAGAAEFPPFAPVAAGEALVVAARDPLMRGMAEPA